MLEDIARTTRARENFVFDRANGSHWGIGREMTQFVDVEDK